MRRRAKSRAWMAAVGIVLTVSFAVAAQEAPPADAAPAPQAVAGVVQVTMKDGVVAQILLVADDKTSYSVVLNDKGLKLAALDGKTVEATGVVTKADPLPTLTIATAAEATTVPPLAPQIDQQMTCIGTVRVVQKNGIVESIRLAIDDKTAYDIKLNAGGQRLVALDGKKAQLVAVMRKTDAGMSLTVRQATDATAGRAAADASVAAKPGAAPDAPTIPVAPVRSGQAPQHAPAGLLAKTVSVNYKDTSLSDVCADLTKKAGAPVTCIGIFANKKVTYAATDTPLKKVLSDIAAKIGSQLYERDGGYRFRRAG